MNSYGTFERGLVIIDVTMAYGISILFVFSQLKNGNNKNTSWALCMKIRSWFLCAGIGPPQLGVVLVLFLIVVCVRDR